jgi:hypothetical protein
MVLWQAKGAATQYGKIYVQILSKGRFLWLCHPEKLPDRHGRHYRQHSCASIFWEIML